MLRATPLLPTAPAGAVPVRRRQHPNRMLPVVVGAVAVMALAGCGRNAPVDALGQTAGGGDPDIAGVSVTSPDAVVEPTPTIEGETTTTSAPAPQQILYTVQPGDTLSGIASTYGVPIDALAAYNGINDPNDLSPGQELAIPPQPAEGPTDPTTSTSAP